MKAGIITHYDVHNHGAQLQMYALSQVLKSLGFSAQALRYNKNYDFYEAGSDKKYNISLKSIPLYFKYLFKNGFRRTLYNFNKKKLLSKFRKKNSLIGEFYSRANNLDLVVIGSDEIFSFESGVNPWYWGIGVQCQNIISYAASFGPTDSDFILKHNVSHLVEGGANNIGTILVRDENSQQLIKQFSGKESEIVCDPVILYSFRDFLKDDFNTFKKPQKKKYCIVYSYDSNMNDKATINAIKEYAKRKNISVYSVGYYHGWCDKNIMVDPLEIFKWFSNADMVFTDTFHGTVISLVTNSQFLTKIRGNGNKLRFLLKQFGVSQREVDNFSDITSFNLEDIDYVSVNERIRTIREKSMKDLVKAIKRQ